MRQNNLSWLHFPIAVKLSLTLIFLMLLWFSTSTVFGIYQLKNQMNGTFDSFARQHIHNSESFLVKSILTDDRWVIYRFLTTMSRNDLIKDIGVIDTDYHVIAHTDPIHHPVDSLYKITQSNRSEVIPLQVDNTTIASLIVEKNSAFLDDRIETIIVTNVLFFIISAIIATLVAMLISKRILSRLSILTKNSELAAKNQWSEISIPTFREKDEITDALDAFSHMGTEIQKHLDMIEATQRFYKEILEAINMPIFICDTKLNILYHNIHPLWEHIGENTFSTLLGEIAEEISSANPITLEKTLIFGEETMSLLFHVNLVEGRQYVISVLDVSRLKELEKHEQMAHSLAILGQISASLSHELKNFLSPLKLLIQSQQQWNEKDRKVVSNVVGKMDKLLINFLQFAKPPTLHDSPEPFDLAQVCGDIVQLLLPQFENKHVSLQESISPVVITSISRKQIEIILMNLLLNALDASVEGSIVSIRIDTNEQGVELIVEDHGSGIDPAIQNRIFEPFFTTKKGGTGLGLATVYRIVYDAGGQMHLYSHPGLTRFSVYFPYHQEQ